MQRTGRQRPTFQVVGDYDFSLGSDAVEAFEAEAGATFDDAQKFEMELFLARRRSVEGHVFAALAICIAKPRQNGKSYAARWYAVDMALAGMRVLYSAHHSSTTAKMFKELCSYFEDVDRFPGMAGEVRHISRARGYESIQLNGGGCIDFQTRTNAGGRGGTYDIIIVDEAQELTYDQLEALLPTMSASGHEPQIIYIGTPPGPSCLGTVFLDMHDKAHSEDPGSVWWLEWSVQADSIDQIDVTDKDLWYETNPAMGSRIMERTVQNECDTMRPDGFARERLGWWSPTASIVKHPISANNWKACEVDKPPQGEPTAYAVKFSPDGAVGSIALCIDADTPFVEVAANRSMRHGVTWFARWLSERADRVEAIVVDGKSNAQTLVDKLLEMGVDDELVVRPSTADVISANTAFVDATREHAVSHAGQPALVDSATLSGMRKIGRDGGFGFESNENADATLVEACALAYWCAMSIRRNPRQELRIG